MDPDEAREILEKNRGTPSEFQELFIRHLTKGIQTPDGYFDVELDVYDFEREDYQVQKQFPEMMKRTMLEQGYELVEEIDRGLQWVYRFKEPAPRRITDGV